MWLSSTVLTAVAEWFVFYRVCAAVKKCFARRDPQNVLTVLNVSVFQPCVMTFSQKPNEVIVAFRFQTVRVWSAGV